MNIQELQRLLSQDENPKLEFKQEFYEIRHANQQVRNNHWGEFIKDILSIENGNVNYCHLDGHIIFGASDKKDATGNRSFTSIDEVGISDAQILEKVNSLCDPPIPNVHLNKAEYRGYTLWILRLPRSPHLHATTRPIHDKDRTHFPGGTVFIRRGEQIDNARDDERNAIRSEKRRVIGADISKINQIKKMIQDMEEHISHLNRYNEQDQYEYNITELKVNFYHQLLNFENKILKTPLEALGRKYGRFAILIMNDYIKKIELDNDMQQLAQDMRSRSLEYLNKAEEYGYCNPLISRYKAEIHDREERILYAYDCCCEGLEHDKNDDLIRFHMKVCQVVIERYPDYAQEAQDYINQHKEFFRMKGKVVDDWGNDVASDSTSDNRDLA